MVIQKKENQLITTTCFLQQTISKRTQERGNKQKWRLVDAEKYNPYSQYPVQVQKESCKAASVDVADSFSLGP